MKNTEHIKLSTPERVIAEQISEKIRSIIERALIRILHLVGPFLPESTACLPIHAQQILNVQLDITNTLHYTSQLSPISSNDAFSLAVSSNMTANFKLWHLEDEARRTDIPDSQIAELKRKIDKENQQRNNYIETIDDALQEQLPPTDSSVPFHSETPGTIIDRLSIICLKIYHMKIETQRSDATEDHKHICEQRLRTLISQRDNLASALDKLLLDLFNGRKRLVLYRPFKMYNDPSLNPSLYKKL